MKAVLIRVSRLTGYPGAWLSWVIFVACATPRPLPVTPPVDLGRKLDRVEALIDHCQRQGAYQLCETRSFVDALSAAGELYRDAGLCRADLEECKQIADIDVGQAKGLQAQAEAERDHAKVMRWVWGGIGVLLGAAVTAGAVLWR